MVIRVVSALAAVAISVPAMAADKLPYDLGFFIQAPTQEPQRGPQISYDISGLLYERAPDHIALGYRLEGLTGSVPAYRVVRDVGPLEYKLEGLVHADPAGRSLAIGVGAP
jgi:hypothetical protein